MHNSNPGHQPYKIPRERQREIRNMPAPPDDPDEASYWRYQKYMLELMNCDSGKKQTWDELEKETQDKLDRLTGRKSTLQQ